MVPGVEKRKEDKNLNKRRKHLPHKEKLRKSALLKHKRSIGPNRPHSLQSNIIKLNKLILIKPYKI